MQRDKAADLSVSVSVKAVTNATKTWLGDRNVTRYKCDAEPCGVMTPAKTCRCTTAENINKIYVRSIKTPPW